MKKILPILIMIILLISCTEDNNTNFNQLNGKWFMQSFTIFGPSNPDLSEEYILWDFDTENNKLNVVNYYTKNLFLFSTGQYDYVDLGNQISINTGTTIFTFDYTITDDELIISDHPELDGPLVTFVPKEVNCVDNPIANYQWLEDIQFAMIANANLFTSQLIQYTYNGECFYLLDFCELCEDNLIYIYNDQGEVACQFGGISGLNTCPDFLNTATNKRYIFNNRDCDIPINITSLEEEYNCTNTEGLIEIDLIDNFTIIKEQSVFDDLVTGDCHPQIDFSTYDLVIGKHSLGNGYDLISYELIEDCITNNLKLKVTFTLNDTEPAPILTYHALVPKIDAAQTLEVIFETN